MKYFRGILYYSGIRLASHTGFLAASLSANSRELCKILRYSNREQLMCYPNRTVSTTEQCAIGFS